MKYRVKCGKIHLKVDGKKYRAVSPEVIDIPPELAMKFKDQLEPLPGAKFLDEEEHKEMSFSSYLRVAQIRGETDHYDVINTITGKPLNDKPLTKKEADLLVKGKGLPVAFTAGDDPEKEDVVDEDLTTAANDNEDPDEDIDEDEGDEEDPDEDEGDEDLTDGAGKTDEDKKTDKKGTDGGSKDGKSGKKQRDKSDSSKTLGKSDRVHSRRRSLIK